MVKNNITQKIEDEREFRESFVNGGIPRIPRNTTTSSNNSSNTNNTNNSEQNSKERDSSIIAMVDVTSPVRASFRKIMTGDDNFTRLTASQKAKNPAPNATSSESTPITSTQSTIEINAAAAVESTSAEETVNPMVNGDNEV